MLPSKHVLTVDAARGIMAFSVMLYHLLHYEGIASISPMGTYTVYGFFVISGFSLYLAYHSRLQSGAEIRLYFKRRFLRIAPLFYCCVAIYLVLGFPITAWQNVFYNLTFLMAFADPGASSILTGGWSIGIEMAFYVGFPILVLLCGGSLQRLMIAATVLFVAQTLYANQAIVNGALDWVRYTQPLTFAGYFASGCVIARLLQMYPTVKGNVFALPLAALCILPFIFAPWAIGPLLDGISGLFYSVLTIAAIGAIAFMREPKAFFAHAAKWLGRMSYPAYLLHPIVYGAAVRLPEALHIPMTIFLTILASELVNRIVEKPFQTFGRGRSTVEQATR